MKLSNIFRHRKRSALLLLVGIAASCLIFLAWQDNSSSASLENRKEYTFPARVVSSYLHTAREKESVKVHHTGTTVVPRGPHVVTPRVATTVSPTVTWNSQHLLFTRYDSNIKLKWNKELYYNASTTPSEFRKWRGEKSPMCDHKVFGYENEFLETRDITINRKYCICELQGGEHIQNVINQAEAVEYYRFETGCFQIACTTMPSYIFNGENHLTKWLNTLRYINETADHVVNEFTIAITRYEYANLFHTMTDWYNAFLLMQFFNHTAYDTNILIVDAHPYGALDSVWNQLFNSTVRLASLPQRTRFKHLVWGILGYNSLMKINVSPTPPLYEDFRNFFLSAYDINADRRVNCKKLSILFIWRHDYVAHPRNPSGFISRKVRNEEQLLRYIKRRNSNSIVNGVQIDAYSMRQQLQFVADADIFIGMHGAGLTHAVFLQKKTAVIELVPNYWSTMAEHFKAICTWRGLFYTQWYNSDTRNEYPDQSTHIPPQIMNTLIKNSIRDICGREESH